jgi:hypothetical protein
VVWAEFHSVVLKANKMSSSSEAGLKGDEHSVS